MERGQSRQDDGNYKAAFPCVWASPSAIPPGGLQQTVSVCRATTTVSPGGLSVLVSYACFCTSRGCAALRRAGHQPPAWLPAGRRPQGNGVSSASSSRDKPKPDIQKRKGGLPFPGRSSKAHAGEQHQTEHSSCGDSHRSKNRGYVQCSPRNPGESSGPHCFDLRRRCQALGGTCGGSGCQDPSGRHFPGGGTEAAGGSGLEIK